MIAIYSCFNIAYIIEPDKNLSVGCDTQKRVIVDLTPNFFKCYNFSYGFLENFFKF